MKKLIKSFLSGGDKTPNCEHKEWDQDHQIRVIQCRQCGLRAWLRDTRDLFKR